MQLVLPRRVGARVRSATRSEIIGGITWSAFALAGISWTLSRYSHNYYYYDEWKMIDQSHGSWTNMFMGFQGHLEAWSDLLYRLERMTFGLEGHRLVYGAFAASLAAMQLSLAAVLRRLGVPTVLALLAATVATYLGPGAQGMAWEFMVGINFAIALCFIAAFVALRDGRTDRAAVGIAALLVLAVGADSGLALFGAVFVGVVVVVLWPRQLAVIALAPPFVAQLAWFAFGDQGVQRSASIAKTWTFANRLFLYSLAALVGGGEDRSTLLGGQASPTIPISTAVLGLIVLIIVVATVAFGAAKRRLSAKVVATSIAGLAASLFAVALIAKTRAFLIPPSQFLGSRYVQWIAVFLIAAFVPGIAATLRFAEVRTGRIVGVIAAVALVTVFVVNLDQFRPARDVMEGWSNGAKLEVQQAVRVLSDGCPPGRRLDLRGKPSPDLDPQISVRLLQDLLADGALTHPFGIPATAAVRDRICKTDQRS